MIETKYISVFLKEKLYNYTIKLLEKSINNKEARDIEHKIEVLIKSIDIIQPKLTVEQIKFISKATIAADKVVDTVNSLVNGKPRVKDDIILLSEAILNEKSNEKIKYLYSIMEVIIELRNHE